MLFNSTVFLYAFLPVAYVVFWNLRTRRDRYRWLTLAGYVFYGFWDYRFCALMAFSTLVSYLAGLGMLRWDQDPKRRKLCLVIPIVTDLLLLGFFKYSGLLLDTIRVIAARFGSSSVHVPIFHVILPIGISFYTFHTISYIVDSYRRTISPTRDFFEFSCYVSLFCQLVAGPIVRFRQIEDDLDRLGEIDRRRYWNRGWSFFVIGMIKKVVVADMIAAIINPALSNYRALGTIGVWAAMVGYTYQIYFDFSGYSDMAVGLGLLFGLHIPQNFDSPYNATDPSDFWRRWHISLSTCLRDYLYIPLGGNRRHIYRNLLITMLLGGLWHGASWTFVAWGAYHGALLIAYRRQIESWDRLPHVVRRTAMFLATVVGWVLFRADTLAMARWLLERMFAWHAGAPIAGAKTLVVLIAVATAVTQLAPSSFQLSHEWRPYQVVALTTGFAVSLAITYGFGISPFLYFQF
jgi:alginate O-acetyltransferase complex protein AlgI